MCVFNLTHTCWYIYPFGAFMLISALLVQRHPSFPFFIHSFMNLYSTLLIKADVLRLIALISNSKWKKSSKDPTYGKQTHTLITHDLSLSILCVLFFSLSLKACWFLQGHTWTRTQTRALDIVAFCFSFLLSPKRPHSVDVERTSHFTESKANLKCSIVLQHSSKGRNAQRPFAASFVLIKKKDFKMWQNVSVLDFSICAVVERFD